MSGSKWYWRLQVLGWTFYALLGIVLADYFYTLNVRVILFQFFAAFLMLSSTHLLRYWLNKYGLLKLDTFKLFVRIVPRLFIMALIINSLNALYGIFFTDLITLERFSFAIYSLYTLQTFVYLSLWTGIYLIVYFFRNYKSEEIEKWKLQAALKDAELIALKAQINPHFLFNALNNIRALILEDQMKARDMVSHLSELLRYSIQFSNNEKVTIAEELEIVQKYLELETIHYEKRLTFSIDSCSTLDACKIPPMIIQLMAENAVKHGISQVKGGGEINVKIGSDEDELILEVSNTGKLKPNNNEGLGLRNASERIRILFEKEPNLQLFQEGEMVKSILRLPLEK